VRFPGRRGAEERSVTDNGERPFGRIVLFTGAGASVRLGMPTMRSFVDLLDSVDEPLRSIAGALKAQLPDMDAEQLYSRLQLYLEMSDSAYDDPHIAKLIGPLSRAKGRFLEGARIALAQLQRLMLKCWGRVSGDTSEQDAYAGFLSAVAKISGGRLSVFTTNYDLTFESLPWPTFDHDVSPSWNARLTTEVINGMKPHGSLPDHIWNESNYDRSSVNSSGPQQSTAAQSTREIFVHRLHGCSHWVRGPDGNVVYQAFPTVGDKDILPMVVFPARGKYEAATLRVLVHGLSSLETALAQCKLCLVIGYSFRDEPVAGVFRRFRGLTWGTEVEVAADPWADEEEEEAHVLVVDDEVDDTRLRGIFGRDRFVHIQQEFGRGESDELILSTCREKLGVAK
jgi:NAD-dependent SIR2 family protein deacetylase